MSRLHLPIQNPCHENWEAMNRDGAARRFCDLCTKHVHDLTAMTEREARSVLVEASAKGRVCVRYRAGADGNVAFVPETTAAPSLWRTTVAAAGMTLALLTGCTDSQPERILDDHCEYEVGPWSFVAPRGQGTCPAVLDEIETVEVMGDIGIEPELELPEPEMVEVKGEAPMLEPEPEPEPKHMVMGKMAPVELEVEPVPEPEPVMELMGDVEMVDLDAPCDPV